MYLKSVGLILLCSGFIGVAIINLFYLKNYFIGIIILIFAVFSVLRTPFIIRNLFLTGRVTGRITRKGKKI